MKISHQMRGSSEKGRCQKGDFPPPPFWSSPTPVWVDTNEQISWFFFNLLSVSVRASINVYLEDMVN